MRARRFRHGPAWTVNLHEAPAQAPRETPPAFPLVMTGELCPRCEVRYLAHDGSCICERQKLSALPRAPGDRLNCADLTREAAIAVTMLAGGLLAHIIIEKLETGRKPGGPELTTVIAWLCAHGLAWRPRNAATEARLTPKGQAKAQSVLIQVSAGNF